MAEPTLDEVISSLQEQEGAIAHRILTPKTLADMFGAPQEGQNRLTSFYPKGYEGGLFGLGSPAEDMTKSEEKAAPFVEKLQSGQGLSGDGMKGLAAAKLENPFAMMLGTKDLPPPRARGLKGITDPIARKALVTNLYSFGEKTKGELAEYKNLFDPRLGKDPNITDRVVAATGFDDPAAWKLIRGEIHRITQDSLKTYMPRQFLVYRGEFREPGAGFGGPGDREGIISVSFAPNVSDRFGKGRHNAFVVNREDIVGWPGAVFGDANPHPYERELLVKRSSLRPVSDDVDPTISYHQRDVRRAFRKVDPIETVTRLGLPEGSGRVMRLPDLLKELQPDYIRAGMQQAANKTDLPRARGPIYVTREQDGKLSIRGSGIETFGAAIHGRIVDVPVVEIPPGMDAPFDEVIRVGRRTALSPRLREPEELEALKKEPVGVSNASDFPFAITQTKNGRVYKVVRGQGEDKLVLDENNKIVSISDDMASVQKLLKKLDSDDTLAEHELPGFDIKNEAKIKKKIGTNPMQAALDNAFGKINQEADEILAQKTLPGKSTLLKEQSWPVQEASLKGAGWTVSEFTSAFAKAEKQNNIKLDLHSVVDGKPILKLDDDFVILDKNGGITITGDENQTISVLTGESKSGKDLSQKVFASDQAVDDFLNVSLGSVSEKGATKLIEDGWNFVGIFQGVPVVFHKENKLWAAAKSNGFITNSETSFKKLMDALPGGKQITDLDTAQQSLNSIAFGLAKDKIDGLIEEGVNPKTLVSAINKVGAKKIWAVYPGLGIGVKKETGVYYGIGKDGTIVGPHDLAAGIGKKLKDAMSKEKK